MSLDEATWGEIARLWRETDEPLGSIARRFAIAHQSISAMANRQGWPARPLLAPKKAVSAAGGVIGKRGSKRCAGKAAATKARRRDVARTRPAYATRGDHVGGSAAHAPHQPGDRQAPRHSMVERLFQAMDTKLSAIEDRIANGEDATPADSERTTRAINTLVRSLEKLTEYEAKLSKTAGRRHGKRAGAGNDPERRREELARRIQRLLDRR